jgi:prepilin-type N-terminal cleavage/methylation domain-containing protein/prepilin-type processing-associated H-X9-DG protein
MQRSKGFTLIELLVVIAIIAILAAILFPVFAQARAKARQVSCLSNIKQLTLGVMMYKQDYDEFFPYWSWANSYEPGGAVPAFVNHFESYWINATYPYTKNGGILACPSANSHDTLRQNGYYGWTTKIETSNTVPALLDQVDNQGISEPLESGGLCGNGDKSGCSDSSLERPAETLVIGDCSNGLTTGWDPGDNSPDLLRVIGRVAYPNVTATCWNDTINCGATQQETVATMGANGKLDLYDQQARHSAGTNIGFGDGHAKWRRSRTVLFNLFAGRDLPK